MKAQLFRVPLAANAAIYRVQNGGKCQNQGESVRKCCSVCEKRKVAKKKTGSVVYGNHELFGVLYRELCREFHRCIQGHGQVNSR